MSEPPRQSGTSAQALAAIGTYTEPILFGTGELVPGRGSGIHLLSLDQDTGDLRPCGTPIEVRNPSYLALHPRGRFLYAVNELKACDGHDGGALSAFAVDRQSGTLEFLNRKPTLGADPCHVLLDAAGRHALVSNYSGGSLCVLPVALDGSLGDPVQFRQHEGRSVHPRRQAGPHVHSTLLDPAARFAVAADLGTDRLAVYRYDAPTGKLAEHEPPWFAVAPGAGPRHMVMHPDGRHAYLVCELSSTVVALEFDPDRGRFRELQTLSTLPPGCTDASSGADIHIAPNGAFLYCSNRGHDSIAVFGVEAGSGVLAPAGHVATGGRTPRGFTLDSSGRFLLVANQDSDRVVVLRIDDRTGMPRSTGVSAAVGSPACVAFLGAAESRR